METVGYSSLTAGLLVMFVSGRRLYRVAVKCDDRVLLQNIFNGCYRYVFPKRDSGRRLYSMTSVLSENMYECPF